MATNDGKDFKHKPKRADQSGVNPVPLSRPKTSAEGSGSRKLGTLLLSALWDLVLGAVVLFYFLRQAKPSIGMIVLGSILIAIGIVLLIFSARTVLHRRGAAKKEKPATRPSGKESKGFWDTTAGTLIAEAVAGVLLGTIVGVLFQAPTNDFQLIPCFMIAGAVLAILHIHLGEFLQTHLTTYRKDGARPPFYKDSTILGSVTDAAYIGAFLGLTLFLEGRTPWFIPLGMVGTAAIIFIGCLFDRMKVRRDTRNHKGSKGSGADDDVPMPYYTPDIWM